LDEDRKSSQIMEVRPEETRISGRQRKIYIYDIEEMARKKLDGVTKLRKIAGDRRAWRR
jgi:hypothetical protein